jgi:hypothetical protein
MSGAGEKRLGATQACVREQLSTENPRPRWICVFAGADPSLAEPKKAANHLLRATRRKSEVQRA